MKHCSPLFADQEKIKREPQLFLPVRPDTLFAPYDIHKQGLQTNRCSVSEIRRKVYTSHGFLTIDIKMVKKIETFIFLAVKSILGEIVGTDKFQGRSKSHEGDNNRKLHTRSRELRVRYSQRTGESTYQNS